LAVFLQKGASGRILLLTLLLTFLLFWIGGVIHAIWLQTKK
jgi:uncharacterized membrane protein YqaE (UPF0057 family)